MPVHSAPAGVKQGAAFAYRIDHRLDASFTAKVNRYINVALTGIFGFLFGVSLLGLANGSIWQWRLLCVVEGAAVQAIAPTGWVAGGVDPRRGGLVRTPSAYPRA